MGHAPLFWDNGVHLTSDKVKTLPKEAHIKLDRACPVRFPQLVYSLAREHERHAPPLVALHAVERTPDAVQERSQKQIVRDYGR